MNSSSNQLIKSNHPLSPIFHYPKPKVWGFIKINIFISHQCEIFFKMSWDITFTAYVQNLELLASIIN